MINIKNFLVIVHQLDESNISLLTEEQISTIAIKIILKSYLNNTINIKNIFNHYLNPLAECKNENPPALGYIKTSTLWRFCL